MSRPQNYLRCGSRSWCVHFRVCQIPDTIRTKAHSSVPFCVKIAKIQRNTGALLTNSSKRSPEGARNLALALSLGMSPTLPIDVPLTDHGAERSHRSTITISPPIRQVILHSWTVWFAPVANRSWTSTSPRPLRSGVIYPPALCKSLLRSHVFINSTLRFCHSFLLTRIGG